MKPPSSIFERPVFARVRRACLALPGVIEKTAWGHPNFRAGRQTFCAFEMIKGRPSIAFKLTPASAKRLLGTTPHFATPYGRSRWVSVWVDGDVDHARMAALVERSYRDVAGGKSSAKDGGEGGI